MEENDKFQVYLVILLPFLQFSHLYPQSASNVSSFVNSLSHCSKLTELVLIYKDFDSSLGSGRDRSIKLSNARDLCPHE